MENRRILWPRIIAEFLAILAGVTLALLADDWRDYRNDRADERLALEEIADDLATDSVELAAQLGKTLSTDQAVLWLLRHLGEDLPNDSVMAHYSPLHFYASYEQVRSGFAGLRDAGRLSIIQDATLRRDLVQYYEVTQPYMTQFYEMYMHTYTNLRDASAPHLRMVPDSVGDTFRSSFSFRFERPWREVSSDKSLVYRIEMMGHLASVFALRIGPALEANSHLRGRIHGTLQ